MALKNVQLRTLAGEEAALYDYRGSALLVVNVASQCGLTQQYAGLQGLQERFARRGFTVLGFPCNQFGGQEPGNPDEIQEFCSNSFGVTFPMFDKIDVNGENRHALYEQLTTTPDGDGRAGDIDWNFEKFLVSPELEVVKRYRPTREPSSNHVVLDIKAVLPS